jgi:D-tyrosyl-tRNA(Tyr) deacylase
MRVVIQRVSSASVTVDHQLISSIGSGLMILAGFEAADNAEELEWMSAKIANLRIFDDEAGVMNLSVKDSGGEILLVSQFTLHASTKKGNRPSYIRAAPPEISIPLYKLFIARLTDQLGKEVKTGIFGAEMRVELVNEGPVTIVIDSRNREF